MSWKKIIKRLTPQQTQVIQNFFDAKNDFEDIFEEMVAIRRTGKITTDEQAKPYVERQILALKKLQQTSGIYLKVLEDNLRDNA